MNGVFTVERVEERWVDTVGPRIDYQMTPADAIDGFFIEVEVADLLLATTTVNAVHAMTVLSDADLAATIAGNTVYNVNTAADAKNHLGDITFDFRTRKVNRIFIKPGTVYGGGGITLPAFLLPVITLRFNSTTMKVTRVDITRRGVV